MAGMPTTLELPGKRYLKSVDKFAPRHVESADSWQEFMRECAFYGCAKPSSYGSVFHAQFNSPRVRHTFNHLFGYAFVGGWQEAKATGVLRGRWKQYDLNSAYLWASTLGLPKVASFRYSEHIGKLPGLYNLELECTLEHLPYPFNEYRFVNATSYEIELYGLPVKRIIGGVTWDDCHDEDAVTRIVKQFTFQKEVSRAYWGRWCSDTPIDCVTKNKTWQLRNPVLNYVWAHFLVSSVKAKVWQESKNACHIFVDSIITPDELPIGSGLGEWKLVKEYEQGVRIRHAGFYGPAKGKWDKTTGKKKENVK